MAKKPETKQTEVAETPYIPKFNKEQILKSQRYADKRDLLFAVLKDGKFYTFEDVERLLDEFMKKGVK